MKKPLILFCWVAVIFLITGCELINPPEDIPAYIYIPSYEVVADTATEGTASANVSDVWVTTGTRSMGAYELPALVPILEEGATDIYIQAGVKQNGISGYRFIYPFYKTVSLKVDLKPAVADTIIPVFRYKDSIKFAVREEFEDTSIAFELYSATSAPISITNDASLAFEGKGALHVNLNSENTYLQLQSKLDYELPFTKQVWLEINYKTAAPINIGLIPIGADLAYPTLVGGVNPSGSWKKLYFYLSPAMEDIYLSKDFKVYIESFLQDGQSEADIYIDNIKLIY